MACLVYKRVDNRTKGMTDYFETKSQPIRDELVHPTKILHYLCVIYKHEEPCEDEGRYKKVANLFRPEL